MDVTGGQDYDGNLINAGNATLPSCAQGSPYTKQASCYPRAMRFNNVGLGSCKGTMQADGSIVLCTQPAFDLVITNQSGYVAHNSKLNRVNQGHFGQINVKGPGSASDDPTELDVRFCFKEAGTDDPFTVDRIHLSFFDFDTLGTDATRAIEELTVLTEYVQAAVSANTELQTSRRTASGGVLPGSCVLHENLAAGETHCNTAGFTRPAPRPHPTSCFRPSRI